MALLEVDGLEVTYRLPASSTAQAWPDEIRMTPEIRELVTRRWKDYGL